MYLVPTLLNHLMLFHSHYFCPTLSSNYQDVKVNSVIAVAYEDGNWYLANVVEKNEAAFEFKVHLARLTLDER